MGNKKKKKYYKLIVGADMKWVEMYNGQFSLVIEIMMESMDKELQIML